MTGSVSPSGAPRDRSPARCTCSRPPAPAFLLDAGLFQGQRAATHELNAQLPFDPRRLDGVVLSHAHIDHSGRLPLPAPRLPRADYATPATRDSAPSCCPTPRTSRRRTTSSFAATRAGPESEPLYNLGDAIAVQDLMVGVPYRRITHLRKHLALEFLEAGHILGSATVDLRISEGGNQRLVFSGDIGRSGLPIVRDPEPPSGPIDTLIVESTYADRDHESVADAENRLGEAVRRTAAARRQGVDPRLRARPGAGDHLRPPSAPPGGQIPDMPIYVDSPLAVDTTTVFRMHPEVFDQREHLIESTSELFDFPLVHYVRDVAESKALNTRDGPAVIIAASGMAESGRILHHLAHGIGDPRNLVLFVGFQAEHTLGRRIQDGEETVTILGQEYQRRAEVETIGGYSAHADRTELRAWVRRLGGPIRRAFVVHGEPPRSRPWRHSSGRGSARRAGAAARRELRLVIPERRFRNVGSSRRSSFRLRRRVRQALLLGLLAGAVSYTASLSWC